MLVSYTFMYFIMRMKILVYSILFGCINLCGMVILIYGNISDLSCFVYILMRKCLHFNAYTILLRGIDNTHYIQMRPYIYTHIWFCRGSVSFRRVNCSRFSLLKWDLNMLIWIPWKLAIPSRFISWKTHFLILAGSGFYQIWLEWEPP